MINSENQKSLNNVFNDQFPRLFSYLFCLNYNNRHHNISFIFFIIRFSHYFLKNLSLEIIFLIRNNIEYLQ